jgi:hypothetical protein
MCIPSERTTNDFRDTRQLVYCRCELLILAEENLDAPALDPGQGRFLNRDPIGYNGGINLYSYVGNSPLNGSDPSGLKNCLQAIADGDTDMRYDRCYQSDWNAGSRPGVAGAQQFVDHAIQMVPGGGLIYMFAGYDVWGCHLSPWQRIIDGANGIGNAIGAMDAAAGMAGAGLADAEPSMLWFSAGSGSACLWQAHLSNWPMHN